MLGIITAFAAVLAIAALCFKQWSIAGMLLSVVVIAGLLLIQNYLRSKNKKDRYHRVHWNDGHITKDE